MICWVRLKKGRQKDNLKGGDESGIGPFFGFRINRVFLRALGELPEGVEPDV